MMRNGLWLLVAGLVMPAPRLHASRRHASDPRVHGVVIGVQKYKVSSPDYNFGGGNPSDAPLNTRYYAYEISVRVDCTIYVGRYETLFNYLPGVFARNRPIELTLSKHVMKFELDNDDLRMGIVRHQSTCGRNLLSVGGKEIRP